MEDITTSSVSGTPAENTIHTSADGSEAKADSGTTVGSILSNSKTHLAIGVAATLGVMIYYKWRERQMAEKEPEEYARLQRIKASVRNGESHLQDDDDRPAESDAAAFQPPVSGAATGAGQ